MARIGRRNVRMPDVLRALAADRTAFGTLLAACALIAATGLDPHILDPGMPAIRASLKADPGLQGLFVAAAVVQSAFVLLGGFVADTLRSMRVVRAALGGLLVASLLAIVIPDGPLLVAVRIGAWFCDGMLLPFAIGMVATAYGRTSRATALGITYAVMGAATALAPALALALGPRGAAWPAFLACAIACLVAWRLLRRMVPPPPVMREHRLAVAAVVLLAFGAVALAAGTIGVSDAFDPIRIAVDAAGVIAIGLGLWLRARESNNGSALQIRLRPVVVALAAGVVIGFAQAAPMLHLPIFFQLIQGAPPLVATIAIAPFVVALLVAGPASGWLLARTSPRMLIGGGVLVVAVADLLLAVLLRPDTGYPWFIAPFLLIGAGFVVATTVRTAIIFASMPRALPSVAAALNEASLGVGSRLGVVVATVVMLRTAIDAYTAQLGGVPAATADQLAEPLRTLVTQIGLPSFAPYFQTFDAGTQQAYMDAVAAGMRQSELVLGVVALVAAVGAFLLMGRGAPMHSVWDLADERSSGAAPSGAAAQEAHPG